MRCAMLRCNYNDDGYCRQPDYACIDKNGVCEQMVIKKMTVAEKYRELKLTSDSAFIAFDEYPTPVTSDTYGIAVERLRDFCTQVVAEMVEHRPDLADNIYWEDED